MAIDTFVSTIVLDLIIIPISALLLMLSTKIFKLSNTKYLTAIKITAILGVISIIITVIGKYAPTIGLYATFISIILVSILLAMWLIKSSYKLDWGKSILVWLVWFIFELVAAFVIGMIVAAVLLTSMFA